MYFTKLILRQYRWIVNFVVALVFCLLFTNCATVKYPKNWPELENTLNINSYVGRYHGKILYILNNPYNYPKITNDTLGSNKLFKHPVDFYISDDLNIRFVSTHNKDSIITISNHQNSRFCNGKIKRRKNTILIRENCGEGAGLGFYLFSKNYCILSKASDESLIVKKGTSDVNLIFGLIPIPTKKYHWYRITSDTIESTNPKFKLNEKTTKPRRKPQRN